MLKRQVQLIAMVRIIVPCLMLSIVLVPAWAADEAEPPAPAETEVAAATENAAATPQTQGLIPIPDFTGDLWTRSRLTGDWGGTRTDLANMGIQFDTLFTQTVQSVVDGGRETGTRYGGSLDYLLTLDLMRMGLLPGAMVKFRGETRYGEAANDRTGALLPVNTDGFFPLGDSLDDDIAFTITNLMYYQFFSEQFGVAVGKTDTLDGDLNEFASGRGTSQFLNSNFVFPTAPMVTVPYSTLAAGILWKPVQSVTVTSMVLNSSDSSTTTGFEDFGDGTAWLSEASFQYRLGDLPGGQNVGFVYGFDRDFIVLGERLVFEPGQGLAPQTDDETWAGYWSAWQYLFVEEASEQLINLTDGRQDLQGVGLFVRIGFADQDTNPLEVSISGGISAKGLIPGRDDDTCGLAYYYLSIQTDRLADIVGIDDKAQGVEAYYDIAITPATHLTFDLQVVDSPQERIDPAMILGMRLNLLF